MASNKGKKFIGLDMDNEAIYEGDIVYFEEGGWYHGNAFLSEDGPQDILDATLSVKRHDDVEGGGDLHDGQRGWLVRANLVKKYPHCGYKKEDIDYYHNMVHDLMEKMNEAAKDADVEFTDEELEEVQEVLQRIMPFFNPNQVAMTTQVLRYILQQTVAQIIKDMIENDPDGARHELEKVRAAFGAGEAVDMRDTASVKKRVSKVMKRNKIRKDASSDPAMEILNQFEQSMN